MISNLTLGEQRRLSRIAAGRTVSEEARRCGVSHTAIQHREAAQGILRKGVEAGVRLRFTKMWQSTSTIQEIARAFNRSNSWVSLMARRLGLPGRQRGRRKQ